MKVNVVRQNNDLRVPIKADWRLYQLIMFNIIQNAVKYNKREGTINVTTELKDSNDSIPNEMIFETIVTDDGQGIEKERIPNLFKVFGELKYNLENQSNQETKDNGIGVGLCCSKIIANALNGDVDFIPNPENKAKVRIVMKVKIYERNRRNSNVSQHSVSHLSEFQSLKKMGIGQDLVTAKALHIFKKKMDYSNQNGSSSNSANNKSIDAVNLMGNLS
jgi:K+-sensing histidine kinase KdpD